MAAASNEVSSTSRADDKQASTTASSTTLIDDTAGAPRETMPLAAVPVRARPTPGAAGLDAVPLAAPTSEALMEERRPTRRALVRSSCATMAVLHERHVSAASALVRQSRCAGRTPSRSTTPVVHSSAATDARTESAVSTSTVTECSRVGASTTPIPPMPLILGTVPPPPAPLVVVPLPPSPPPPPPGIRLPSDVPPNAGEPAARRAAPPIPIKLALVSTGPAAVLLPAPLATSARRIGSPPMSLTAPLIDASPSPPPPPPPPPSMTLPAPSMPSAAAPPGGRRPMMLPREVRARAPVLGAAPAAAMAASNSVCSGRPCASASANGASGSFASTRASTPASAVAHSAGGAGAVGATAAASARRRRSALRTAAAATSAADITDGTALMATRASTIFSTPACARQPSSAAAALSTGALTNGDDMPSATMQAEASGRRWRVVTVSASASKVQLQTHANGVQADAHGRHQIGGCRAGAPRGCDACAAPARGTSAALCSAPSHAPSTAAPAGSTRVAAAAVAEPALALAPLLASGAATASDMPTYLAGTARL